ncbi:hypothetical protein cyc_05692 [Cyclospora cayetanensis]|uniref:Uncharacterized protein n=1 Tax=Cyclospora cayetanensis TaxID=88456 RepID=A0A1D3D006_9EIME|nr:hypothetical protein cyc_05692 [Cyclospora cayetanensis]
MGGPKGRKQKRKAKQRGSPEIIRFRETKTFSLIAALVAETAKDPDIFKRLLLPSQQQGGEDTEESRRLSLVLHLLGRLADELKASKCKDYRFLWAPDLLTSQQQYCPSGYPLSVLQHSRSLAASPATADSVCAAEDSPHQPDNAQEDSGTPTLFSEQRSSNDVTLAPAPFSREFDQSDGTQQDSESSSSSSSSRGSDCCLYVDGVPLEVPADLRERSGAFLVSLESSIRSVVHLAADGISSNFAGGLVGFLGDLKVKLRDLDELWCTEEEALAKALFGAVNHHLRGLTLLLEAEASITECEANEELLEALRPQWIGKDIPKDAIELAESVIFYELRMPKEHMELCCHVIRAYLRADLRRMPLLRGRPAVPPGKEERLGL